MTENSPWGAILLAVGREARRADERYGDFTSTHEAFGVLAEEVAELLEAVRANDLDAIGKESTQVAAVALRLAQACHARVAAFATRSGV